MGVWCRQASDGWLLYGQEGFLEKRGEQVGDEQEAAPVEGRGSICRRTQEKLRCQDPAL